MKSRNSLCSLVCGASLLVVAGTASANLIVNGSFEDTDLSNVSDGWGLYDSIPGWTAIDQNPNVTGVQYPIEIGLASVYGVTGQDGNNVMEMDSTGNAIVDQIVAIPGGNYSLSFLYAQRVSVSSASGSFEVWWNGSLVQSVSPTSTLMSIFSQTVTAQANNTLEFRGTGTQNSYGALVDDVQLNQVPDGGLTSMLLGMGMLGLGYVRRMVK